LSEQIESKDKINQHVLNVITPPGIDYTNTTASLGENIGKIYCISKFPTDGVDYGWLAELCNLEGTITQIEYKFTDSGILKEAFDKQIREFDTKMKMAKEESEKQVYKKKIDDLKQIIHKISVRGEPVGYMNILLFIQDYSEERLNEGRIKRVNSIVESNECNMRLLKYKQCQAMQAIAPYGLPSDEVKRMGNRNIPLSSFTGGFPMSDSGINDKGGYFVGKTKNGRLVFLNQWLRNKDRVNSNWIFTGVPGVGKSTTLKDFIIFEYAYGTKLIIWDPEGEVVDIAKHPDINGDVIDCGGGSKGRINPLQIRTVPLITEADLAPGETMDDYYDYGVEGEAETSPMALHIRFLRTFFKLYFGKAKYDEVATDLEKALIRTYNKKGITWNTDVSKFGNDEFPFLTDLYETVQEELKELRALKGTEYSITLKEKLLNYLYPAVEGADKFLWNGPTTLSADSDFVVLVTSSLQEADDNVKNAQNFNISSWSWSEMSRDRKQKVSFCIDEGYLCVDPEYPELMKFLRNVSKRDRKYEGGLMFITHSVVDILDPAVKRFGQAIIDNACYKFIMGCDGKNLEETAKLFNLSSKEISYLEQKNRGEGILFAGGVRQAVKVEVPKKFLEMMGDAGGR